MRLVKQLISPTGKRKVSLYERDDGRFSFEEEYEVVDDIAGTYWTPGYHSGMFDRLDAAEAEMCSITPWLRTQT